MGREDWFDLIGIVKLPWLTSTPAYLQSDLGHVVKDYCLKESSNARHERLESQAQMNNQELIQVWIRSAYTLLPHI
jgi:hypothetical protein